MKKAITICAAILTLAIIVSGCITGSTVTDPDNKKRTAVLHALKAADAKLYVTPDTCPHCKEQLEILGPQASDYIEVIDCINGDCDDIQYIPTWEINGEHHIGLQSLDELATILGI